MKQDKIYIAVISIVFVAIAIVFDTFPRSTFSQLEKRDLAQFPKFSIDKLLSGEYAKSINSWFSDSEPYRDFFMNISMKQKDLLAISASDDNVTFHASKDEIKKNAQANGNEGTDKSVGEYNNDVTADENAKIANKGIIIVGKGKDVRALMAYGGSAHGGTGYADAANAYKRAFGSKVNVYCMVVPTAVAYYCPDKAKDCTNDERATIINIHSHLDKDVYAIDAYSALGKHAKEPIFLRTDHHWSALGAYYAAQEFARVAKVPFRNLDSYERKVVHGYVGTMYGYSQDLSIKNAPEDFVYYVPKGIKYTTNYQEYKVDRKYQVTGLGRHYDGPFFVHYRDGATGAYCTFMGGDAKITTVTTGTHNGRRLLILKDSFGNALPGFLFFSFDKIFIVDNRYFTRNMKQFVNSNKITDILFANNIFSAYSPARSKKYVSFLTQSDHFSVPSKQ